MSPHTLCVLPTIELLFAGKETQRPATGGLQESTQDTCSLPPTASCI